MKPEWYEKKGVVEIQKFCEKEEFRVADILGSFRFRENKAPNFLQKWCTTANNPCDSFHFEFNSFANFFYNKIAGLLPPKST